MYIHTRTHGPKQPSQLNSQCFAHPRVYRRMYTKFLRTRRSNDDALYTGNSSVETFHRESPNQVSSPAPSTFCCSLPYAELNGALHLTGRPRRSPSPKPCEATQGRRRQPRRWPAGSPRRYLRQRRRREQAHQIQTVPPPPREPGPSPPPKPPRPGVGSSRTARALGFLFPKKVVTAARGPESRGPAPRAASPPSALHVPPGRGGERRREAAAA